MGSISNLGDPQERLENLQGRLVVANGIKTQLRKLNVALSRIAIADGNRAKLAIINSAIKYVDGLYPPSVVKAPVKCIRNELQSLSEGIQAKVVRPTDFIMTSGTSAVDAYMISLGKNIQAVQTQMGVSENDEAVLKRNAKYRSAIKSFGKKDFQIARVPVSFTFQNKQGHSSVGYVDTERLDMLGFKAANLGGYTVLYDQLVIGIAPHAVFDRIVDEESGATSLVRKTVKESAIKFHKDKPESSTIRRPKESLDMVAPIKKQLEAHTNQQYTVMSDRPSTASGIEGAWFWLMPTRDVKRLASVFPGGFFKINRWGLAF
jgi:hypothetical protein